MICAEVFDEDCSPGKGRWRLLLGNRVALQFAMEGRALCGHNVDQSLNVGEAFRKGRYPAKPPSHDAAAGDQYRVQEGSAKRDGPETAPNSSDANLNASRQSSASRMSSGSLKSVHLPLCDRLAPDAEVNAEVFECHLSFLRQTRAQGKTLEQDCTVLVNCNLCVNRSPTLVLLFLVSDIGLSLREAYRRLFLAGHRSIDPLPPYRRMLLRAEESRFGACSVSDRDAFSLHFTDASFNGLEFEEVIQVREASIDRLLLESVGLDEQTAPANAVAAALGRPSAPPEEGGRSATIQ